MSKKKTNLLAEAVADASEVRKRAIENAKIMLMESLEDKVEKLVSEGINDVSGKLPSVPMEAEDEEELNLDELPDEEEEVKEASEVAPEDEEDELEEAEGEDELEQGEKETPEQKRKKAAALEPAEEASFNLEEISLDDEEEEVEEEAKSEDDEDFSDEEVEEVYAELKLNEVDQLGEPDSKVNPEDHIEKDAKGEKPHEEQDVPAKQDFIPKEYFMKKLGFAGKKLMEHKRVIRKLMREMAEVNLLNAKLKATHDLTRLTENKKTKEQIIGVIDQAKSVAEVSRLAKGTKVFLSQLTESKRPIRSPLNRSTSNVVPRPKGSKKVVNESAGVRRLQMLANIIPSDVNETDDEDE